MAVEACMRSRGCNSRANASSSSCIEEVQGRGRGGLRYMKSAGGGAAAKATRGRADCGPAIGHAGQARCPLDELVRQPPTYCQPLPR